MLDLRKAGAYISSLRKQKDMTQVELADMLNVSHQAVSKWERGDSMPDIGTLPKLAEIFDTGIEEILYGGEAPKDKKQAEGTVVSQLAEKNPEGVADMVNRGDLDMEALVNVAPILKPSMVNDVAQKLDNINIEHLLYLAPFLNSETINKLVENFTGELMNGDLLIGLAPFIDKEKLDDLADNISGNINEDLLIGIAPFLSKQALGKLVDRAIRGSVKASTIMCIAPFLGRDNILKLIGNIPEEGLTGDILAGLVPFIGGNNLSELIDNMINKKKQV